MITIERTTDAEKVRRAIANPFVYRHLGDDSAPPINDFRIRIHPEVCYLLVHDGNEFLGCITLYPKSAACAEVHLALTPAAIFPHPNAASTARGRTLQSLGAVFEWAWRHSRFVRLCAEIPAYNRLALKLAQKAGMMEYGVNPKSWLKDGVLHDQVLVGISKPEAR